MEDGLTSLSGRDPASGKRPPVANSIHLVEDRDFRIARPEKVGVEGVHRAFDPGPIGDGATRRHQSLRGHLAAEDPQAILRRADATVEIHVQGFQIEQVEEGVEGGGHASIMACLG